MKTKNIFLLFAFYLTLSGTNVLAQLTWHTPLTELNTKSKLVVEGKIITGSLKAEEESHLSIQIRVEADFRNNNAEGLGLITVHFPLGADLSAYTDGVHAIFFIALTNSKYQVFDPAFGVTILSSNRNERAKAIRIFGQHLRYVNQELHDSTALRRIVLSELSTKSLFNLGFATLYDAMDSEKDFEQFSSDEQVKLFDAFKSTPLWTMDWLNLMLIYNRVPKKTSDCIKYILGRAKREKDKQGPLNQPVFSTDAFFCSLCVIDASVPADLGTGIESHALLANVARWSSVGEEEQIKIVNRFFEAVKSNHL